MAKTLKIEHKCEKCGKSQHRNEEKSNKNWVVYDCNKVCECGGKFVTYINGQKTGM